MKFTDGRWRLRPGVQASYPVQLAETVIVPDQLSLSAATRRIEGREDLVDIPLVSVTCSSPAPDVIAVRITHFSEADPVAPSFQLAHDGEAVAVTAQDGDHVSLSAGRLTARVTRHHPWHLEFLAEGRRLTGSGAKAMAFLQTADGEHFVRERLDLGTDHLVYGLGERFGPVVKNGQSVDIWNADGGTTSEQAYKNVPFLLTNAGYGIFVDHPGRVSFEIASEDVSRLQFSVQGHSLRYLLIYGPSPKEILRRYTALTGRPARPPAWSFGLWLSTSFTTAYDERTVTGFIDGMAQRDLPLSVFHFDCFWMREFHWTDLQWDPRAFPDPVSMLDRLKARGLRICLWINPYIAQRSSLFDEGRRHGYLLRRPGGRVWQTDGWQPGMGIVDFTNPQAREWFTGKLDGLLEMGVDCFKTDFGERIPTEVEYFDGSDPHRMHNYYSYLYNESVFELLRKRRGEGEAVLFARSATAGSQRFPVHWGGDCDSTFEAMAQSLRGGLSLGMSGFGFWSHDIGGFEGTPDPALFKRWIAFGLLSSHSRLHGRDSYRVPWAFDEESVDVLRRFTRLKHTLMPYLLNAADEAAEAGTPLLRAMPLEFPDDPACAHLDRQYMLGGDLLVAPVFRADGTVTYYVPDGTWTQVLTGELVEGPRWVREHHDVLSVPLLARPGSVIPFGAEDGTPEYDYADGVTLRVYQPAEGVTVTTPVPAAAGAVTAGAAPAGAAPAGAAPAGAAPAGAVTTFVTTRTGDTVQIRARHAPGPWRVLLPGMTAVRGIRGGIAEPAAQGVQVRAEGEVVRITGAFG